MTLIFCCHCHSLPLAPTHWHVLAYTCRVKLFYGEVIFPRAKLPYTEDMCGQDVHNLQTKLGISGPSSLLLFSYPCFGCKVSASWIGNSGHALCEGINRVTYMQGRVSPLFFHTRKCCKSSVVLDNSKLETLSSICYTWFPHQSIFNDFGETSWPALHDRCHERMN